MIPTLDYYKYTVTFFPWTIIHWNALPAYIPVFPTLAQQYSCLLGGPLIPLKHQYSVFIF